MRLARKKRHAASNAALRDGHREATETLSRPSKSDVRIIYFDKQEKTADHEHVESL